MTAVYIKDVSCLFDENVIEQYLPIIKLNRRKKIEQLKSLTDKALSLGVELCLINAIEGESDYKYSDIETGYDANGKPFLTVAGQDDLFFISLSHSGKYAVCAISDKPIGVDIEKNVELKQSIADRFFNGKTDIKQWTERESRGKLTGVGFFDKTHLTDCVFTHYTKLDGYIITTCSKEKTTKFVLN